MTKRRQMADELIDRVDLKRCMTNSTAATARELFVNDKLLIKDSDQCGLKQNWFANVYAFLKWQQKVIKLTLYNLVASNASKVPENAFLFKFDSLVVLNAYLDQLIEYLVLYYCCFDAKLWIAVFYPFIEACIGTLHCQTLLATSASDNDPLISKQVKSICDETLEMGSLVTREKCLRETMAIKIFKLLLCDVYDRHDHDILLNAAYIENNPFDLVSRIDKKLNETVNNIIKQVVRNKITNTKEKLKLTARKMMNVDINTAKIDDDETSVTIEIPSFIALFIIHRIIKHLPGGVGSFKKLLFDDKNRKENTQKDKTGRPETEAEVIVANVAKCGIVKYMKDEFDEKKHARIVQLIFDRVKEKFAREYEKEMMFSSPKKPTDKNNNKTNNKTQVEKKDIYGFMGTVFNVSDLPHYIFQFLQLHELNSCSLVCSTWLYYAFNPNSVYNLPLKRLIEQSINRSKDKVFSRQWQRFSNAQYVQCNLENTEMSKDVLKKLEVLSNVHFLDIGVSNENYGVLQIIATKSARKIESFKLNNMSNMSKLSPSLFTFLGASDIFVRNSCPFIIWSSNCTCLTLQNVHQMNSVFFRHILEDCDNSGITELVLDDARFKLNWKGLSSELEYSHQLER